METKQELASYRKKIAGEFQGLTDMTTEIDSTDR